MPSRSIAPTAISEMMSTISIISRFAFAKFFADSSFAASAMMTSPSTGRHPMRNIQPIQPIMLVDDTGGAVTTFVYTGGAI